VRVFFHIASLFLSDVTLATETLGISPLQDVSSTPSQSSDQVEVNAVAGNEVAVGGPAEVLPVPKVMTPVSCLNEICVVRKLSIPQYEPRGEVGVAHMKIFTMGVWVRDMELRGMFHSGISHIDSAV